MSYGLCVSTYTEIILIDLIDIFLKKEIWALIFRNDKQNSAYS